ncbi:MULTISPECIES: zf-HC2 domain-containing protein [unclassified Paenibacillus]|uniref:zf-HC2 domain-containing protein n=1 Tax=unclassified Paenibacillus TaxID=185978 RepID=UPI001C1190D9|nr:MULTISPECIES: zf-HC2 domain-containing protein [unclassified Paenibacillus]MBU5445547.1 zf-HC2 domain-containing protein [Paenibacillus sp. MSJ-34]CAH0122663.1 Anti-sigma-W factor RsiW [Paenibacillus sp. CECT 9249]
MDCSLAVSLMHDYLDGDLAKEQIIPLKQHIMACPSCRARYEQLERTEMMMYSLSHQMDRCSDQLTARIFQSLPKKKMQNAWLVWVKRHPALTAAAVFAVVMLASVLSVWNQDRELMVKGSDLDKVVIEGDTVIVPPDRKLAGNLTVQNGKTEIFGEVQGNLTVIDGSMNLASTAHIAGQVTQIDQAMDWLWYKITHMFSDVALR